MKNFGLDFAEDSVIDKMKLDVECEVLPAKYYFYASALAEAKAEQDTAKDNLTATQARRDLFYRMNPPDGLKATEAVFTSLVDDDREVQAAQDALRVATAKVGALYASVNTMELQKDMLGALVKLSISQYYASGEVSDESRSRLNK